MCLVQSKKRAGNKSFLHSGGVLVCSLFHPTFSLSLALAKSGDTPSPWRKLADWIKHPYLLESFEANSDTRTNTKGILEIQTLDDGIYAMKF